MTARPPPLAVSLYALFAAERLATQESLFVQKLKSLLQQNRPLVIENPVEKWFKEFSPIACGSCAAAGRQVPKLGSHWRMWPKSCTAYFGQNCRANMLQLGWHSSLGLICGRQPIQ